MEQAKVRIGSASRTRSIAFVGLTIAIMAVSAWVTIPLGPVPFTLQMFALTFAIVVLTPRQCMAAVAGYLLLGAVGLPVFSGMRGGIGVLAGPTGGFLWGYLFGAGAAVLLLYVVRQRMEAKGVRGASALGSMQRGASLAEEQGRAAANAADIASAANATNATAGSTRTGLASTGAKVVWFLRNAGVELVAGLLFTAVAYVCGWAQFMAVAGVSPEAAFLTAIAPFIVVDVVKIVAAVICARAVKTAVH